MKAVLLSCVVLCGCTVSTHRPYLTLIDQRTFAPAAAAPSASEVKALPKLPLATVRFDVPDYDDSADLAQAVSQAQAIKPDAEFNVMTPVARGTAPTAQASKDAADVARGLAEQNVPPDHIHVGLVEDAGTPPREVLIYVR